MRKDLAEPGRRDVGDGGQAVLDLPRLLADDEQVVLTEQCVDLVDAAGGGVLDRQEGQVRLAGQQRGGCLPEGTVAVEDPSIP